jgi:two-component system sensor histidine kinase QseC
VSSIRRFLLIVLLATMTLINFLAALHGYRTSMAEAEQIFDGQLVDIADVLALTAGGPPANANGAEISGGNNITFQVWRGGQLENASANAPAAPIAPLNEGFADVNFAGYRWRAFSRHVPAADRWLIVAERTDLRFQLAENIILESVVPIILGLPLAGLLIWVVVGRGLKPLRSLADEMGSKASDDLRPLTLEAPPQELAVLRDSINDLLRRLEASFESEKRFAADAAHELRTPISVLKVQLHNLLSESDSNVAEGNDKYSTSLQTLRATVERMEQSVEQLLLLYRTTPEQFAARVEELDLAGLARAVIAGLYPRLEAARQQIELVATRTLLRGDEFALRTLLTNLIENASKYGGAGGHIRVTVAEQGEAIELTVEDDGPGISAEERVRVFERFYRGTERRDAGVAGSGLGLAIAHHVVDIHGAGIRLEESGFATGLAVHVLFPQEGKQ